MDIQDRKRLEKLNKHLQDWEFMEAAQIIEKNDVRSDLILNLVDLFGSSKLDKNSDVGIVIKHALMRAGINNEDFERIPGDSFVAGRLHNFKFESAFDGLTGKESPQVEKLVTALYNIMGNPGSFSGSWRNVVVWAIANIIDGELDWDY